MNLLRYRTQFASQTWRQGANLAGTLLVGHTASRLNGIVTEAADA
jgi:hypothetical protein